MSSIPNEVQQKCFKKYNCMDAWAGYKDGDSVEVYLLSDDKELWQFRATLSEYLAVKLRDRLNQWYEKFHESQQISPEPNGETTQPTDD